MSVMPGLHPSLTSFVSRVLRHRVAVSVAWVTALVVAFALAGRLPQVVQGGADPIPGSETGAVIRGIERAFGRGAYYLAPVLVRHPTLTVDDPGFAAAVARASQALVATPGVRRADSWWSTGNARLLGRDRHSALLLVTPSVANFSEAETLTPRLRAALDESATRGFESIVTGTTAMLYDLDQRSSSDLLAAERVGLPITLLILLVVFRAPLAALLPVLLALAAVTACNAVLVLLSRFMPVSVFAENVTSMIGLGVGVDYALFVVSRWRRELTGGASPTQAARIAAGETGGAVLFSAATVAVGFLALLLVDAPFLRAVAVGGICVVAVAALAAVTLLPVLLSLGGKALVWPASAKSRPATTTRPGTIGGPWAAWARVVMRRPWAALVVSAGVLLALAWPALGLRGWNVGTTALPTSVESRRGHDLLREQFAAGWMGPTLLLVQARDGSLWTRARLSAMDALAQRLAGDPRVAMVTGAADVVAVAAALPPHVAPPGWLRTAAASVISADGRTAAIGVVGREEPSTRESGALVSDLRSRGFAAERAAGLYVAVGGPAAGFVDFDHELFSRLPVVVAAVLLLTFLVLAASFRSVVLPLKAIVVNLLSVLAAYGFLVLVFQHGVGAHLLGVEPTGGINAFVVLMLFTILFGLSMDYEVFLLARVRDGWRRTGDTRAAVESGLAETAGVITSAALIMISIFAAFACTRLAATRMFGLGLAFAVALDATLVRVVLVPALMVLAGRANWWWPFGSRARR